MVKWEALSRPKEFGGLGFLDVRVMNTCLLAKWIDILERGDNSLCCFLLRRKYLGQKSIFQIKNKRGSQFWRSLLDIRKWYQMGRKVEVRSGQQTSFWHDCWLGDYPLNIAYSNLYQITSLPDIVVERAFVDGHWSIPFRRQLSEDLREELQDLIDRLAEVHLT